MSFMTSTRRFPVSLSETLGLAGAGGLFHTFLRTFCNASEALAAGLAVAAFLAIFGLLIVYRLWNSRENQFQFVDSDHGEAADSPVKRAGHHIYTTHFTSIIPHEPYRVLLKSKLDAGIKVKRIVFKDPAEKSEKYEWLKEFAPSKNYRQIDVEESFPLPLDIMIFDHKAVVLHLPSGVYDDDFYSAIIIKNEKIAGLFENVFHRLEARAREIGRKEPKLAQSS